MSRKPSNELIREDIKEVKDSVDGLAQSVGNLEKVSVQQAETLGNLEKVSIKQQVILEEHMKRSDLLERSQEIHRLEAKEYIETLRAEVQENLEVLRAEVKPITTHVAVVGGIAKVVTFIGVLVGIVGGIAKIVGAF